MQLATNCGKLMKKVKRNWQPIHNFASRTSYKGVILTGPGSVWFGTVVILTRPVQ